MFDEIDIEELYRLLDGLEADLQLLNSEERGEFDEVHPSEVPNISDAVLKVFGPWSAYGSELAQDLKIPADVINSFSRSFRPVYPNTAKLLASRLISYLRSIESSVQPRQASNEQEAAQQLEPEKRELAGTHTVTDSAESVWAPLPQSLDAQQLIAQVAVMIDSVILLARNSNLPQSDLALTQIERAQLIAILETALALLKAPMVEKSLLKKARSSLGEVASKVAKKKTEAALGQAADHAVDSLSDLISKIPWS